MVENSDTIKVNEIPAKFKNVFEEVGLKIEEFLIYPVKGDGACGANSTALHCHRSQKLGPYVMRNVNEFIVKFWPFFQDFIQFPLTVKVGLKTEQFGNEECFLEFLKSDSKSGYLWMDHLGWQAVSNMYQISIHILTTGINMEESRARWTHIVPDDRLSKFSEVHKGLPDMWVIHEDETHFDLIVNKESVLVREGTIEELEKENEGEDKSAKKGENIENVKLSKSSNGKIECEKCKKTFNKQADLTHHSQKNHRGIDQIGPGYMGWETSDVVENESGVKELKKSILELIENQADMEKEIKKQRKELKEVKEEYKVVLDILKDETYARTKAETYSKVLKETLDAKNELEKLSMEEDSKMEIDEGDDEGGKWQRQRSEKRKQRKRNRQSEGEVKCKNCGKILQSKASLDIHEQEHKGYRCEKCDRKFTNEKELKQHENNHVEKQFNCKYCNETFKQEENLKEHSKIHASPEVGDGEKCETNVVQIPELEEHVKKHARVDVFDCSECDQRFKSIGEMEQHLKIHVKSNSKVKHQCSKCENNYEEMRKLRRHDWRCHRTIECNICGDKLRSRQEIRQQRENEHKMFNNRACKFFPDCYDEDECLYEHKTTKQSLCPMGQNCEDQECSFSENEHKSLNRISCRFQERCNRGGCLYQHNTPRQSFLGIRSTKNVNR